jgi:fatty acid synthase subunit beta
MDTFAFATSRLNVKQEEEYSVECAHGGKSFVLPVKEHLRLFACRMRNDLLSSYIEKNVQEPCSDLHLLVQFLRHIAGRQDRATSMSSELFSKIVEKLSSEYLQGKDIHLRAAEQEDAELRSKQDIIKCYYEALHLMQRPLSGRIPHIFAASHPSERVPTYTCVSFAFQIKYPLTSIGCSVAKATPRIISRSYEVYMRHTGACWTTSSILAA